MPLNRSAPLLAAFLILAFAGRAEALPHALPSSIAEEALSESVPFSFPPDDRQADEYSIQWVGAPIPGVQISLGEKSLEWVRVSEVLVIPRGRAVVHADGITDGQIAHRGFAQPFVVDASGKGAAEIPVALVSNDRNTVDVTVKRDGRNLKGKLIVRYKPKPGPARVHYDTSCSSLKVHAPVIKVPADQWVYVGCRLIYAKGSKHRTSGVDLYVFWDNRPATLTVGGVETAASSDQVWQLRLRSQPGTVRLVDPSTQSELVLAYSAAERLHTTSLGAGIGPYSYTLDTPSSNYTGWVPLLTLYGSFFMTENLRIVAFNATPIAKNTYNDLGVYINLEQTRAIDKRFIFNLMFGAHVLSFGNRNEVGAPQGFEMIWRDLFLKNHNIAAGAFIYPPIQGTLYYNAWVRWGTPAFFGEINYLSWQEPIEGGLRAYSRSFGISFGMPLARFF